MAAAATLEKPIFDALIAPELEVDEQIRFKANQFIGACLTRETVELSFVEEAQETSPIESLYDALLLASEGDVRAREMVETNVATDFAERTYKSGHIVTVQLDRDEAGRIQQFGQTMESVQANSLKLASSTPQMLARTKAETTNAFRIAEYHRQGLLEDNYVLVCSRAADDMSQEAMEKAGFFIDTMSVSLQLTGAVGENITTQSAFVAGKRSASAVRHDKQTVTELMSYFGADVAGKSAAEILAMPLVIPKKYLPNGVIDLVKLYDRAAGGDVFFGGDEDGSHDYDARLILCMEREENFRPRVSKVADQLIKEAHLHAGRLGATRRLNQLSQDEMVLYATIDESVNPRVFGPAAPNVMKARKHKKDGNQEAAMNEIIIAQHVAVTYSCPSALKESGGHDAGDGKGPLHFVCKRGHPNIRPYGGYATSCSVTGCEDSVGC